MIDGFGRVGARRAAVVAGLTALLLATAPGTVASANAAAGAASTAPGNRIAVLPLEIIGEVPAGRAALEAAVAKGLVVAGVPVTIGPEVGTKLNAAGARVACVDAACWIAAGRALGARHLIAGVVERKGPVFQVEFRLVDATVGSGREVLKEANHCDVADCSVAELCRLTVHELARAGLSRPTAPAAAAAPASSKPAALVTPSADQAPVSPPPTPAGAVASDGARPFPDNGAPPASSELSGWSSPDVAAVAPSPAAAPFFPRWFPIAAVAGGVVAGGIGGFLIYKDHECTTATKNGDTCPKLYRTLAPGVATLAGGAILVATGIVVGLTRDDGESTPGVTSVSIGPGSVGLAGKF